MTLRIENIGDTELLAYVDGQLDTGDMMAVEEYLRAHPEAAEKVAAWRRQTAAIRTLFDPVASEPVPAHLSPGHLANHVRKAQRRNWRMAAAAVVVLALGAGAGWYVRGLETPGPQTAGTLISAAVGAHTLYTAQTAHPVEVGAERAAHLAGWLSASLDRRLVVPDLTETGYTLLGGRLLPEDGSAAAQLMYTSASDRLTLYLTPRTSQPGATEFATRDGTSALYWANDMITCTIVGDLPRSEMEEIASKVFAALDWQDESYRPG